MRKVSPVSLEGLSAKELRAFAKLALKEAKRKSDDVVTIHHPKIVELTEAVAVANHELKLKTIDTVALVLRRMRLGYVLVPRSAQRAVTELQPIKTKPSAKTTSQKNKPPTKRGASKKVAPAAKRAKRVTTKSA